MEFPHQFEDLLQYKDVFLYILGFVWILFASDYFANSLQKIRLPLITGFLLTGIVCGPQVLGLIKKEALHHLNFVNDLSLAFIAFGAGAELYLREIRRQLKSILWNTFGQLVVTFTLSSIAIYYLSDHIPFMSDLTPKVRAAISILMATIFIARSPSSAIAVINELRSKGPFTQTAIGVTVLIDVLVIVLFTICFAIADTIILEHDFDFSSLLLLLLELSLSLVGGYILGRTVDFMLRYTSHAFIKTLLLLLLGFSVFFMSQFVYDLSLQYLGFDLYFEPLLICIVAAFWVTNYSANRPELQYILHRNSPFIYVTFFTLTGAMISLDLLAEIWGIALLLFLVRLITIMVGSVIGSALARDEAQHKRYGWMPYVTQAGVGLGLAIEVSREHASWGYEFSTIIIGVIVLNQLVGPPLFKWALTRIGESHKRADPTHDGIRDVIIFGLENSSVALGRQLLKQGWEVKIATLLKDANPQDYSDLDIRCFETIDLEALNSMEAGKSECVVLMMRDAANYKICELIYEQIGTKNVVVRLQDRTFQDKFNALGALIVEPATAMVSLLDHFVRSPWATSLLLGMEEGQETVDIEVQDRSLHGISLRNLRLPSDIIILSVQRNNQMLISHGYTRLRLNDVVTLVGSSKSIEETRLRFEAQ